MCPSHGLSSSCPGLQGSLLLEGQEEADFYWVYSAFSCTMVFMKSQQPTPALTASTSWLLLTPGGPASTLPLVLALAAQCEAMLIAQFPVTSPQAGLPERDLEGAGDDLWSLSA